MKKNAYIGISFIILLFGIIFIPRIVARIKASAVVKNDRMSAYNTAKSNELAYLKIDDVRKKVPKFAFLNQDSLMITNHDFKGKVFLVDFFFVNCPTICPKMTRNLKFVQSKFKDNPNFGIASFTINPEMDTPSVLKKYAEDYKISNPDWHFLTGERKDIYNLANTGFNLYAQEVPEVAGGFEHSGFFALIDKDGFFRSRYDANGNPIIYYRGTVSAGEEANDNGEVEQISLLIADIKKLLNNE